MSDPTKTFHHSSYSRLAAPTFNGLDGDAKCGIGGANGGVAHLSKGYEGLRGMRMFGVGVCNGSIVYGV